MDLCALRRGERHGCDPCPHPSCRRHGGPALWARHARVPDAMRGGVRAHPLGPSRARRRQEPGVELPCFPRSFSRHLQPGLLHHQNCPVGARGAGARASGARHRAAAAGGFCVSAWFGLGLLLLVAAGIVLTGLPAFVVLIAVASFGALVGLAADAVPFALLTALPGRLVNLLENDLLQALPLYVLMGLLLDRLPIAQALFRSGLAILPPSPTAPLVSGMGLGALLGPMNGSVGASVLGLARVVAPRLAERGVPAPLRYAAVAVASTLGVVIPPSLVLILLGDAMLNAHTIAVTATGRPDRVINTQDVFHGALGPAALSLALTLGVAWIVGRRVHGGAADARPVRERVGTGD